MTKCMKNTRTLSMLPTLSQRTGKKLIKSTTPGYIRCYGIAITAHPHLLRNWPNYGMVLMVTGSTYFYYN